MFVGQRKRLLLPLLFAVPTINDSRFNMYNGVDTFRRSAETILSLVTHGSRFKDIYCWGQIFRRSTETTFFLSPTVVVSKLATLPSSRVYSSTSNIILG